MQEKLSLHKLFRPQNKLIFYKYATPANLIKTRSYGSLTVKKLLVYYLKSFKVPGFEYSG